MRRHTACVTLSLLKRKLICRTLHVIQQHIQVVRMDKRILRRTPKEVFRMRDNVLIKRAGGGHNHCQRSVFPSSGTTGFLPCTGNRTRISTHHAGVQLADIDTKLKRIGRNDRADIPFAQPLLDFSAQRRQISAAISANASCIAKRILNALLKMSGQNLNCQARLAKYDGRNIVIHKHGSDSERLLKHRLPDAKLPVDDRRIVKHDMLFSACRSALVNHFHRATNQYTSEFSRICNRRRAADKLRI